MAKKRIFLSPSDQRNNAYASGNTTEDVQCGRISDFCRTALERCGFDVRVMHYYTMAEKVESANAWGADLYIPIHTNAHNGKTTGTRLFYYSTASEGYKACQAIFKVLAPLTPGTNENISAYPGLYEVKNPKAPTVYVEVDFHDVTEIAEWIIANAERIGEGIAKGVCNYYGAEYVEPVTEDEPEEETAGDGLYRVQVGAYKVKANAEDMVKRIREAGFDAFIKKD